LVDSDARLRSSFRRVLSSYAAVDEAESCEEASRALGRRASYAAFVVEIALQDGSGLEWLATARHPRHGAPALVTSSRWEPSLLSRVFELNARYLRKPISSAHLRVFADSAFLPRQEPARARAPLDPIGDCVRGWTLKHGLTPN
jgi:DNA-binding response OmpR family regulator